MEQYSGEVTMGQLSVLMFFAVESFVSQGGDVNQEA